MLLTSFLHVANFISIHVEFILILLVSVLLVKKYTGGYFDYSYLGVINVGAEISYLGPF